MADLSTMFPQIDLNQTGPVGGMMMGDMFNIAKQNAGINQQGAMANQQREAEMHPLDMMFKQAQTGYQNALSKNTNAQADKSIYDLDQTKRLEEPTYKANLSKLLASSSEDEVKQAHAELEKRLMSTDPKVRGEAQTMYKTTGDMLKMYEQLRVQGETSRDVARINAQGKVDAKNAGGGGAGGAKPAKNFQEGAQRAFDEAQKLMAAGDEEGAMQALQRANALKQAAQELAAARGSAFTLGPDGRPVAAPNAPGTNTPLAMPGAPTGAPAKATPKTPAEAQAAGWKLMVDKSGNRAYVGPNKEILEVH